MRIGTWNLEGRWSDAHRDLLLGLDCDVLLLTEVDSLDLADYSIHRTTAAYLPYRTWAAVATRAPMSTLPDPHPATALVTSGGWSLASTVLPWGGCGPDPWGGGRLADQTARALDALLPRLRAERLIWGGDWNNALTGAYAGAARASRIHLLEVVEDLGLAVPTKLLPHRIAGLLTIDHIAIPAGCTASGEHISAQGLSDHDAYAVDLDT